MAYGLSNGHVSDDVTWPWKVKFVTPICLERNISKTAGFRLCSKGPPIGKGIRTIKWSRDRWRHATPEGAVRQVVGYNSDSLLLGLLLFVTLFRCNYLIPPNKSWPSTKRLSDHRKTYRPRPTCKKWIKRVISICYRSCIFHSCIFSARSQSSQMPGGPYSWGKVWWWHSELHS